MNEQTHPVRILEVKKYFEHHSFPLQGARKLARKFSAGPYHTLLAEILYAYSYMTVVLEHKFSTKYHYWFPSYSRLNGPYHL